MITTINAFNAIEPVKAWLFANSYLWHSQLDTLISRDVFWESSMHGKFLENVGVFPKPFYLRQRYRMRLIILSRFKRMTILIMMKSLPLICLVEMSS
ncbi:hypothetical protein [Pseudolactococcus paracarnosus]|uniref:Uncharacterized protein n=1 Tax=Pseudolactococcus paracarnosus TaxID=2749962 RepID=A0A7L4WDV4_9LACT|nr:hypothetical protein BHS01_01280 [Lactococcus paracarnosus]SPC37890.1 hypothetical protein LPICM02_40125 [Lactococcus piscium]